MRSNTSLPRRRRGVGRGKIRRPDAASGIRAGVTRSARAAIRDPFGASDGICGQVRYRRRLGPPRAACGFGRSASAVGHGRKVIRFSPLDRDNMMSARNRRRESEATKHAGGKASESGRHDADSGPRNEIPAVVMPSGSAPVIDTEAGSFDLDNPVLPSRIVGSALNSDGFACRKRLKGPAIQERTAQSAGRTGQTTALYLRVRTSCHRPVRGPRRRRKGWRDIDVARAHEPPDREDRCPAQIYRARGRRKVFPALCRSFPRRRRDGSVRQVLVQPGWRRASDGILRSRQRPGVPGAGLSPPPIRLRPPGRWFVAATSTAQGST